MSLSASGRACILPTTQDSAEGHCAAPGPCLWQCAEQRPLLQNRSQWLNRPRHSLYATHDGQRLSASKTLGLIQENDDIGSDAHMSIRTDRIVHPSHLMLSVLVAAVVSLSIGKLSGQSYDPSLFSEEFHKKFTIRHFAANNGLPQNEVTSVAVDEDRFVWLGTQGGLVRWDGKNFLTLTSQNSVLCRDRIFNIDVDIYSDQLHVRDEVTCIAYIKGGELHPLAEEKSRTHTYCLREGIMPIRDLEAPGHPRIDTLFQILESTPYPGPYRAVALDSAHWLQAEGPTITLWRYQVPMRRFDLPSAVDTRITFSYQGRYYLLGTDLVLYIVDLQGNVEESDVVKRQVAHLSPAGFGYHTCSTRQRLPVISYGDAFFEFRREGGQLRLQHLFSGVQSWMVPYVVPLSDRRYIITIRNEGFVVAQRKMFQSLYYEGLAADQIIYSHVEAPGGRILTHNNLVYDIADGTCAKAPYEIDWWVYSFYQDERGRIFACDRNHYYQIDSALALHKVGISPMDIMGFVTDEYGHIWTFHRALDSLGYFDSAMTFHGVATAKDIDWVKTKFLTIDPRGNIWICHYDGIQIFERATGQYRPLADLDGADIRDIRFDREGDVAWICTYNQGFYRYQAGDVFHFPLDQDKFLLNAHYILEDTSGYFWIPTNNGLFRFLREELEALADGQSDKFFYEYFDSFDGLLISEFNGGQNTGQVLSNGHFSMASMKGMVTFDPYLPSRKDSRSGFWVGAMIDGEDPQGDEIWLSSDHNELSFSISSPSFDHEQTYYRISGLTEAWQLLEEDHLTYYRLPGGSYSLDLKKHTGFGDGQTATMSLPFVVQHQLLNRPWVRLSILLAILLTGLVIYRVRLRYLTKLNVRLSTLVEKRSEDLRQSNELLSSKIEELSVTQIKLKDLNRLQEHLLSMISHDIRGSLNFISLISGQMDKEPVDNRIPDDFRQNLGVIRRTSDSMLDFVEQLLAYLKSSLAIGDIDRQTCSVRALVEEVLGRLDTRLTELEVEVYHAAGDFQLEVQRPFFISVMHNILENELKHGNGKIEINYLDDHAVVIRGDKALDVDGLNVFLASDSYFYYDPRTSTAGLGLAIIKNLTEKMGLSLHYKRREPAGHEIVLRRKAE